MSGRNEWSSNTRDDIDAAKAANMRAGAPDDHHDVQKEGSDFAPSEAALTALAAVRGTR